MRTLIVWSLLLSSLWSGASLAAPVTVTITVEDAQGVLVATAAAQQLPLAEFVTRLVAQRLATLERAAVEAAAQEIAARYRRASPAERDAIDAAAGRPGGRP